MSDSSLMSFLPTLWFGFLGLFLALYVILDGFDLGVGILSLFSADDHRRGVLMASLSNVWDANETWLIVLGGALFGAFPLAYGTILSALYIPVFGMLFGLIFRAVAFEFREHAQRKGVWNLAFGVGSLVAALAQGFALGGVIAGLPVDEAGHFDGSVWHWLSPQAAVVALGVVAGYALLGATYLIMKTTGPLQQVHYSHARRMAWATMIVAGLVTVMTPWSYPHVATRWFQDPGLWLFAPWPILGLLAFWRLLAGLRRGREARPFGWAVVIFLVSFLGLAMSLYPYIIPVEVTIHEAAAAPEALVFMLVGIGLFIPIMLVYNAFQYRVFRGKVYGPAYGGGESSG